MLNSASLQLNHVGVCSGIGGFEFAAAMAGWKTIAYSEIDPFCNKILKYYFPNATAHGDLTKTDFTIYKQLCDVFTAGFPCQPISLAGKRAGREDDRFLWPATRTAYNQCKPSIIVLENVAGLTSILEPTSITSVENKAFVLFGEGFKDEAVIKSIESVERRIVGTIIEQLQADGYNLPQYSDGTPIILCLPACAVNAPHQRDRIWIVAYSNSYASEGHKPRQTGSAQGESKSEGGEWERLWNVFTRNGNPPAVTNAERSGLEGQDRISMDKTGEPAERTTPDTTGQRMEGGRTVGKQEPQTHAGEGLPVCGSAGDYWTEWPTQHPIHSGNDGFPYRLDGITVSQWRNKSIHGFGNAIVPEVALSIFQNFV